MNIHLVCQYHEYFKMRTKGRENYKFQTGQKKPNYFCNRYLIFSWQNFAFLALAPSCMWLRGLEIRQLGLPKIQGDVCVYLFPVCAVPSSYPSPFCSCPQSLPPEYQLSSSSLPWQQVSVPAVWLCLFISSLCSYVLQLRSGLIFCHYFISFIYQAMCACSKTSTVNILILCVMLL